MKNGSPYEFLDSVGYQEEGIEYNNKCYFFNGVTFDEKSKKYNFRIDNWTNKGDFISTVWTVDCDSHEECMKRLEHDKIIDNKTFWELEPYMTWVDWGIWW